MNKEMVILEVGTEGGSLTFTKKGNQFSYGTSETALLSFLNEEDREGMEPSSQSNVFSSFESALESASNKYPIFRLVLLFIHDDYLTPLKKFYRFYLYDAKIKFDLSRSWYEKLIEGDKVAENKYNWESEKVQSLEAHFRHQHSIFDKMKLLIKTFLEFQEQESFGAYDETVILNDTQITEREETMDFLSQKFKEIQKHIS